MRFGFTNIGFQLLYIIYDKSSQMMSQLNYSNFLIIFFYQIRCKQKKFYDDLEGIFFKNVKSFLERTGLLKNVLKMFHIPKAVVGLKTSLKCHLNRHVRSTNVLETFLKKRIVCVLLGSRLVLCPNFMNLYEVHYLLFEIFLLEE